MTNSSDPKAARRRVKAAEKARWARRRQRQGRASFMIYAADDLAEQLIAAGLVRPDECADKRVFAQLLGDLVEAFLLPD